jgi:cell wall-associated NlpC family hydrolase
MLTLRSFTRDALVVGVVAAVALTALTGPADAARSRRQSPPDPLAVLAAQALEAKQAAQTAQLFAAFVGATEEPVVQQDRSTEALMAVATEVSRRVGATAEEFLAAWQTAGDQRLQVVLTALAQVGDPYRRRSAGPDAFDCSGLTSFAWASAGVMLSRSSGSQIQAAVRRTPDQLLAGDLVWRPGHVMLYLGVGQAIVEASRPGVPVQVRGWGRVSRFGSPVG